MNHGAYFMVFINHYAEVIVDKSFLQERLDEAQQARLWPLFCN